MENVATQLQEVGRKDEAVSLYEKVVTLKRRVYGTNHIKTIDADEVLANAKLRQGGAENVQHALWIFNQTLAVNTEYRGRDHRLTIQSRALLSDAHFAARNFGDAERLRREVWAAYKRSIGESHLMTLQAALVLMETLIQKRDFGEARAIQAQVGPIIIRVLGPQHMLAKNMRILARRF